MAKTSIFTKFLIFFCIVIFAVLVTTATASAEAEKKTTEAAPEEGAAPAAETEKPVQASEPNRQPSDFNPAARVNGVAISRSEFDNGLKSYIQQAGMDNAMITDPDRQKQVQLEVLDGLITRELLWQEAQKKNFIAKDEDVQTAMSQAKDSFPSEDDFKLRLTQIGYTEEGYTQILRQRLSVRELVEKDISQGLSVSDDEIHGYYQSNPEEFKAPEQIRARHILVDVDPGANDTEHEDAKKKIEDILNQAKDGTDFAELAKTHSEAESRFKGGDLGFFSRGQMVKPFEEAAFALKPGEISQVVQTQFGYHIIKVEEKKEPHILTLKDTQEQIRRFLYSRKVQDAVRKRVSILREQSNVEILLP